MWLSTLSLIRYVYACIILYLECMLLKMYISVHGHVMFGVGEGTSSVSYLYCSGTIMHSIAPKTLYCPSMDCRWIKAKMLELLSHSRTRMRSS